MLVVWNGILRGVGHHRMWATVIPLQMKVANVSLAYLNTSIFQPHVTAIIRGLW